MPWKEPGEKPREPREPRGREPWGPRQDGSGGGGPDFEAWLRKARRRLGPFGRGPLGSLALVVLVIVLWFLIGGWTSIASQQVGVVLRFGHFERVLAPGLHLRFPSPIDQVEKVDMGRARTVNDELRLLTRDGQLVRVDYSVHYKITNARDYLYATRDAEQVVRAAATSAMRAAVGSHTLKCLIESLGLPCASGRVTDDQLARGALTQVRVSLARTAAHGDIGVAVTAVGVQGVSVPADVQPAFDAIAKAHDDLKTVQAAAEATVAANQVKTKNQTAAIKADAETYRQHVVADARAGVARFGQLVAQYQAAPEVTRHRLWLDTMQATLTKNRVVINAGTGGVTVEFPVQRADTPASASSAPATSSSTLPTTLPATSVSAALPVTSGPGVKAVD